MKDDQHYIDKIFSDQLSDYKELPDDPAWDKIAAGIAPAKTGSTAGALLKKVIGGIFISGYLLIGPLFYSDLLFDVSGDKPSLITEVQHAQKEIRNGLAEEDGDGNRIETTSLDKEPNQLPPQETVASDFKTEIISEANSLAGEKFVPVQPSEENKGIEDRVLTNVDLSEQEEKQESLIEEEVSGENHLIEVEDVLNDLLSLDYTYKTFLFPVLNNSVPIESEKPYYEESWEWYTSGYLMPVFWANSGIGRAQVGVDVGRYFGRHSALQIGLRYQFSSDHSRSEDIGVISIPVQYRYFIGKGDLRWFAGAGMLFNPGASPAYPFDQGAFDHSIVNLELSGGAIYQPGSRIRFLVAPTWQQPIEGNNGLSIQLGIQMKF